MAAPSCTGNLSYYEYMSVMAMAHPEDRAHSIPAHPLTLTFFRPLLKHDVPRAPEDANLSTVTCSLYFELLQVCINQTHRKNNLSWPRLIL